MERVLVVWCPDLLLEQEEGREARAFARVTAALETFSPLVDRIRPGICALATRGPSRYFGGDGKLAVLIGRALTGIPGADGEALAFGIGVADGLFAGVLAATVGTRTGRPSLVPPGETPAFLAGWPVTSLDRPELADLLGRLGIRTLGAFGALPARQVLARFGTEGAACHRVARGILGDLPGFRPRPPRSPAGPGDPAARQPGFWGGTAGADGRAAIALGRLQDLLGPEAVLLGRLQGGRGPGERARLVPWTGPTTGDGPAGPGPTGPPWPGQVPSPAPAVVLGRRRPAQLVDGNDHPVGVTGQGTATTTPARLSIDRGPWTGVDNWAGPWPTDERWWSARGRRRRARMQVVTATGAAHLLSLERGGWWLEGTYD